MGMLAWAADHATSQDSVNRRTSNFRSGDRTSSKSGAKGQGETQVESLVQAGHFAGSLNTSKGRNSRKPEHGPNPAHTRR